MKGFLQRALGWAERRVMGQTQAQLRDISDRLGVMNARLDDVQAVVEATAARAASSTEQALGVVESDARTARRFEEIERLLGAAPPGHR